MACDPIEGLARIAMDSGTTPELKVRCYAELAQYVYPKRKAVALNHGGNITLEDLVAGVPDAED